MKLNTIDHPKTYALCEALGVELPEALGYLTLLWAFTGRKAPQGNIGKWADYPIARACCWTGNPTAFIDGLVDAGFVDRHPTHRLVVHDWEHHAERWVKASLERMGLTFVDPAADPDDPTVATAVNTTADTTEGQAAAKGEATLFPAFPSPAKDNGQQAGRTRSRFADFWKVYPRKVKKKQAADLWKRKQLDPLTDTIIADIQARIAEDPQWKETRLIPHPTSYMNAERWTDEWREAAAPEDRWKRAVRLAKEKGLEPYKGRPYETDDQFMARVGA